MFDFAWSEFALIGVVALVAIGPKDMPVAIKAISDTVKKLRRMAGEFQGHLDDLMKEADLGEMRGHLAELRQFNLRDQVTRVVDPDGALRATLADTPRGLPADRADTVVGERPMLALDDAAGHPPYVAMNARSYVSHGAAAPDHLRPAVETAPAFIPPDAVAAERALQSAPAFIPPKAAARGLPVG